MAHIDLKYRMIAIDLDGTLLSPSGEVTPRAKAAVHRALAAGMLVCFATGRNFTESQSVLDAIAHYATAVFVGGAMVVDTRQRLTLHRMLMSPQLARQVCAFFENRGHAVLALQDVSRAGVDYLISETLLVNEGTQKWLTLTTATGRRVPDLALAAHEHTVRIGVAGPPQEIEKLKSDLEAEFGSRIVCLSVFSSRFHTQVLEVFDPAVNKWEGIMHVARHHGIEPSQIIAIGDDINDLPMIQNAGLGVAMGNAKPEVLAAAGRVIGSNHEEGLAIFLEELLTQHAVEPLNE